jgi:protein-S-isoprenylcysteine O-methyltransferase Ste14
MEIASYMMTVVYVISFLAMSTILARDGGPRIWLFGKGLQPQALPATLFRLAFAGALIWPLMLAQVGNPFKADLLLRALNGHGFDVFGPLLVVVGACVAILSQRHMSANWRVGVVKGEFGTFVDTGPFPISRNPVFVGQALLFVGLFIVLPGLIQAALTLTFLVAIVLQVRIEVRVLEALLGEPYRAYQQRVRRWLGTHRGVETAP